SGQTRLDAIGITNRAVENIGLALLARGRSAKDFALRRGEGDHDEIVLIGAEARLPLRAEDADDAQWRVLHDQYGTDGIGIFAEELAPDCLPDQGDKRRIVIVRNGNAAAIGDLPVGRRSEEHTS